MNHLVPLTVVPEGQRAEITELHSGYKMEKKLADMGLFIGSEITIANSPGNGFVFVKNQESKIGIGIGMAHKIFVKII